MTKSKALPDKTVASIVSEAHEYDVITAKREIFLHSYYDGEDDAGIEYRVANRFLKNLKILFYWFGLGFLLFL